jgi:hypothetical protein
LRNGPTPRSYLPAHEGSAPPARGPSHAWKNNYGMGLDLNAASCDIVPIQASRDGRVEVLGCPTRVEGHMSAIAPKQLLAVTVTVLLTGACNESSSDKGPAADATFEGSAGEAAAQDAHAQEGGRDAGSLDSTLSDASNADAPPTDAQSTDAADGGEAGDSGPTPTILLQGGSNLIIGGVTSDDWVIYYDSTSQTYYAQPIDGGPITTLYTVAPSLYGGYVTVIGKVAFAYGWGGQYTGPLVSWTSGMSQAATLTSSGLAYLYQTEWASSDSRYVAYLQYTTSDAAVGALYGANADGSNSTLLLSNIDIQTSFSGALPACFPRLVFRGDTAVVSYCTAADAGLTPIIQSFSAANGWASAIVVPNWVDSLMYNPLDRRPFTFPFAVDPDGGRVLAASSSSGNGSLQLFPIDGGMGTVIDQTTALSASESFAGSPSNPWSIVYNDDAGALKQAYASDASPQTLVDGGVNYFNAVSHDGTWMLASSQRNTGGWFADLSLVSTHTPGAPQAMGSSSQYDGGPIAPSAQRSGGSGFTVDDKYALMFTNLTRSNGNLWIGYVRSMSVVPPHRVTLVSNGYAFDAVPIQGSKILLLDAFQDTDGGTGSQAYVDLDVADLASGAPATKIAAATTGSYAFSSDRSKIVYLVTQGSAPGIYVTSVP